MSVDLTKYPAEELDLIKATLRPVIEEEVLATLQTENSVELAKLKDTLRVENEVTIKSAIKDWQEKEAESKKPLTHDDLQKLLTQEYVTFDISIQRESSDGSIEKMPFTLRELPQKREQEFYKLAKETMKESITNLGGEQFKLSEGDLLEKISSLMDVFDPVFTVMAKACAICLNPRNKIDWMTEDWVKDNLTSHRILNILKAQVEINKLRDFFSSLFQEFQSGSPKNPADSL